MIKITLIGRFSRLTMIAMGLPRFGPIGLIAIMTVTAACASDNDGDGFESDVDCDDANPAVHPDAAEICNAIDDNCDGGVDVDPVDGVSWLADADGDGWGKLVHGCTLPTSGIADRDGDCDDDHATAFPGSTATEVPNDGIDTDCDGNDHCTDLNCDGLPDVVIPSHHDGDFMVTQPARLTSGAGGWSLDPTPVEMSGTLGVAVADFDQDGYQDIVHASFNDGTSVNTDSFVYWGASGHAQASRQGLPTHGAHWVCVEDFDGNGYVDILFANRTDDDFIVDSYIYWNRAGAFSPADRLPIATNGATHCSVDDLDGDDHPDIVFANFNNGSFSTSSYVYWGSTAADYRVATRTDLPTIGSATSTIADVDGDGRKDIVFWSHYDGASHVTAHTYIYWNRATGFAAGDRTALSGMGGFKGEVFDLNKDGHNDVIVPGYHNNDWANMAYTYIYWGNATATYSNASRTALGLKGALISQVEDINGDGYNDILLTSHYDGDSFAPSAIFWGTAGGTYNDTNRTQLPGYQVTFGAGVVDFNHDGYKDVFLPGFHNNVTGADPTPWANQAFSRIYWGSATGLRATFFDEWPTRGARTAAIVGT